MYKFSRLLLLWIIAIALPVQGVLAATLQHCVAGEHQVALKGSAQPEHGHAQAVGSHAHGDGHAMRTHAENTSHADQASSSHSHHGAALKGSCSACAACCSSTAPPPMPVVLGPQVAEHGVPVFVSFAVVTFVTDGPERPPRITLA